MTTKADDLVAFIQEHCLWQFASRTPDREENMNGVLAFLGEILTGVAPKPETPMERCHFADANQLASAVKVAFPWLQSLNRDEISDLISGVLVRIHEITVEKSLNGELNLQTY